MERNERVNQRLRMASAAKRFLDEPMTRDFIQHYTDDLFVKWGNTSPSEVDEREEYYAMYRGMLAVVKALESYVADGRYIEQELSKSES